MKPSRALFRILLHAYPARFRRAWGEEMADVFDRRFDDTRGGGRRSRLWLRTLLDIGATAAARME